MSSFSLPYQSLIISTTQARNPYNIFELFKTKTTQTCLHFLTLGHLCTSFYALPRMIYVCSAFSVVSPFIQSWRTWEAQTSDDLSGSQVMPWRFLPLGFLPTIKAGAWQDAMRTTEDFEVGMHAPFFLIPELISGKFTGNHIETLYVTIRHMILYVTMFNREQAMFQHISTYFN